MDDFGLFGALFFGTFVFVGTITVLVVTSAQKVRADVRRFNEGR